MNDPHDDEIEHGPQPYDPSNPPWRRNAPEDNSVNTVAAGMRLHRKMKDVWPLIRELRDMLNELGRNIGEEVIRRPENCSLPRGLEEHWDYLCDETETLAERLMSGGIKR
jgi:hypothetical protein